MGGRKGQIFGLKFDEMESLLNDDFVAVKPKHSSNETLQKWRDVCGLVKNPKRRFRFTANLSKRDEAAAMRKTNQVRLVIRLPNTVEKMFEL